MVIFGTQIKYVRDVINAKLKPLDAGATPRTGQSAAVLASQISRVVMQILVSVALLSASFYILIFQKGEGDLALQKGAWGMLGTITGYWLR